MNVQAFEGADPIAASRLAQAALASGDEAAAAPIVDRAARRVATSPQLWQWSGLLHRALDQRIEAMASFDVAARLAPNDAKIAHGRARTALEAGIFAVDLFEAARRIMPEDEGISLGLAAARVAEGETDAAISDLEGVLRRHPDWISAHHDLAQLRWMMGDHDRFADSFSAALAAAPGNHALWQSLVVLLIHAERYDQALAAIGGARAALGETTLFDVNEAVIFSETGDVAAADLCFSRISAGDNVGVAVRVVRHQLRNRRIEQALATIEPWLAGNGESLMWPYASIAWRISGDPRSHWLEGDQALVRVVDLAHLLPPLDGLAALLRKLHLARGSHLDQSVRGGTQTDGALFARTEPEIRALRQAIADAVAAYITDLPPPDPRHPTLSPRRDRLIRFSGSWSVRLRDGGHHSNHVHPAGWLSSAFYVALPEQVDGDDHQAGWLSFGVPQAELGLDIAPVRVVEPKPGRLVLFPSTMWHGTRPFSSGDRLTVSFDVAQPR